MLTKLLKRGVLGLALVVLVGIAGCDAAPDATATPVALLPSVEAQPTPVASATPVLVPTATAPPAATQAPPRVFDLTRPRPTLRFATATPVPVTATVPTAAPTLVPPLAAIPTATPVAEPSPTPPAPTPTTPVLPPTPTPAPPVGPTAPPAVAIAPMPTPAFTPTATATPLPAVNTAPALQVLEFNGRRVSTGVNLTGGRNQEVSIKLVARDENGDLAYIALIEENGKVLAQESCVPDMTAECTLVLSMTSPEGYGQRVVFFAVAVDKKDLRSEEIHFIVGANLPAVGGSGQEGTGERQEGTGEGQEGTGEGQEGTETPQADESTDSSTSRRPTVSLKIGPPEELERFIVNIASMLLPSVTYDGNYSLFYTIVEGPEAMTIGLRNGIVSWTPQDADEGREFNVTISVSDGQLSEETSFTVTVVELKSVRTKIRRSDLGKNVLVVTDSTTNLEGMEITSPPKAPPITIRKLADLQKMLELSPVDSVPAIPSWITALTDVFAVKGVFNSHLELRIPLSEFLNELPEGIGLSDIHLYAYTEISEAEGHFWTPVAIQDALEGTDVDDLDYVLTLGGLRGLAFFGFHKTEPPDQFQSGVQGDNQIGFWEWDYFEAPGYHFIDVAMSYRTNSWDGRNSGTRAFLSEAAKAPRLIDCESLPPEDDSFCVTPPDIDSILCVAQEGKVIETGGMDRVVVTAESFDNILCTYSGDSQVEITVHNFGQGCRWNPPPGTALNEITGCLEGRSVYDMAQWAIRAQFALEEMRLGYSKKMTLTIHRSGCGCGGYVALVDRTGGLEFGQTIHIVELNWTTSFMEALIYHEYFHTAQAHVDTIRQGGYYPYYPLSLNSFLSISTKWLIEGTAAWFEDEVNDDLNQYARQYEGARIMEVGLDAQENNPPDERWNPYNRFSFFKMLTESCDDFNSRAKDLFSVPLPPTLLLAPVIPHLAFLELSVLTETGLANMTDLMLDSDCDFGDHLDDEDNNRSETLEAAITYYNYATQFRGDIGLLGKGEAGFSFDLPVFKFFPSIPSSLPDILPEQTSLVYALSYGAFTNVTQQGTTRIPAAGAFSAKLPTVSGALPEGTLAELVVVSSGGELIVSLTGGRDEVNDEDFNAMNTIGPVDDHDLHAWFSTADTNSYLLSEAALPPIFFTVVNPSTDFEVEVAIFLRIRSQEGGVPPRQLVEESFLNPSTDRSILTELYNATNGPKWANNEGWLMENYPLLNWLGVIVYWEDKRVLRLDLSRNGLEGELPEDLGRLFRLNRLIMGKNSLRGVIPPTLGDLPNLAILNLRDNYLSGGVPSALANLTNLNTLDLGQNELAGEIPPGLGSMMYLTTLILDNNGLTGDIPAQLTAPMLLLVLDLSDNELTGQLPEGLFDLGFLELLNLGGNNFSGDLPMSIGQLTDLKHLDLSGNKFVGTLPDDLGDLRNLEYLDLGSNQFTGEIPGSIRNLVSLRHLDLGGNDISGNLDTVVNEYLVTVQELEHLALGDNQMAGGIPDTLFNRMKLEHLDLGGNELTGEIPSEVSDQNPLKRLYLNDNQLEGNIPEDLMKLTQLERLYLDDNQLTGGIPDSIDNLFKLEILWLHDNLLSDAIPESLGELYSLEELYLNENQLSGTIPEELGSLYNLERLYLQENLLTGEIPAELGQLDILERLYLQDNQLTGTIPAELGSLSQLKHLDLSSNQLSGDIPAELGKLTNLTELDLSNNDLEGEIPADLVNLYKLEKLFLSGNDDLEGCIPGALHLVEDNDLDNLNLEDCTDRDALVALYNATDGDNWLSNDNWLTEMDIGVWLGVMTNEDGRVVSVALNTDQLNGPIPADLANLSELSVLQLNSNQLTGQIPAGLVRLDNLTQLELGSNQLSGQIPPALGKLSNLTWLILSANDLSGDIPRELSDLENLEQLWLNLNQLDGLIPVELGQLTNLTGLYLSGNSLIGCIPDSLSTVVNHDFDDLAFGFCGGN